jgi:hypothetical protein
MNDLQFLTGPSVADLDGVPGQEVVAGSASDDLQGLSGAASSMGPAWPKLTGDWTVAIPSTGSFGTLDTDAGATKAVVALTRSGRVLAYGTRAPACSAADWPQFHHDSANSGDARRDAVAPGRPAAAVLAGAQLRFTAPGDDLLCGTADAYEVRTSSRPIDEAGFGRARPVPAAGAPKAAGSPDAVVLTGRLSRYVAVRAVDEQGNAGRPAVVDRG